MSAHGSLLRLAALLVSLPLASIAAEAGAEKDLAALRASFEYGKYAEVLERAGARIDRGDLREAELVELHKLAGLSAFNLGKGDSATRHFRALLRIEPDFSLDPFVVPPPAVIAFDDLKGRMATELELIRQEKRLRAERERTEQAELERQRAEDEEQRRRLEALARDYTVQRVEKRSLLVNFVPFGAGQFQQGRMRMGIAFAAGESLLAAASILGYFMYDSYFVRDTIELEDRLTDSNRQTVEIRYIPTEDRAGARNWRYLKNASAGAFYAVYALGLADALAHHQDEVVTQERRVPPPAAAPAASSLRLFPTRGGAGAGLTLRF